MTRIQDLNCDPVIRNAVRRALADTAEQMSSYCMHDVCDLRNMGWRRVWRLQHALLEVGCTLQPCRMVQVPTAPGRRTDWQHQRLSSPYEGMWTTHPGALLIEPTPDRPATACLDLLEEWNA